MTSVDFWFDPLCPWAWTTSRWIVSVAERAALNVKWRPMSLAILNATDDERLKPYLAATSGPVRVCAAIYASEPERLGDFYTALGTLFHHSGDDQEWARFQPFSELLRFNVEHADTLRNKTEQALTHTGLSPDYLAAYDDAEVDEMIQRSHESVPIGAQERELIGVPTISVDGHAGVFGPVISELPDPQHAVAFWQAFATMATNDDFFELKRVTSRPSPLASASMFSGTGSCEL